MEPLNTGTTIVLTVCFAFLFWMLQRTESKYIWVTGLIFVLPVGYLLYEWAANLGLIRELLIGIGVAILLNVLYWFLYGRHNPTGRGDAIKVIGMDDD